MWKATTYCRTLQHGHWRSIVNLLPCVVPGPWMYTKSILEDSDPRFFFHQKSREPREAVACRHRVLCPSVLRSGRL